MTDTPRIIGWREWVGLPDLNIPRLKAKVDTGARTSALHAFSVEPYVADDGAEWVRFGIHPVQNTTKREIFCEAPVLDRRIVTDSGGHQEERIAITTTVVVGDRAVKAELTLTSRDNMRFRMLLGRTAMKGHFAVDPARSYVCGDQKQRAEVSHGSR